MKTTFISEKAKSRFNLNFILSPITALVLMAVAETVGYFAFISLAVILWARFVEKSPWLGLGMTKTY